MQLLTPHRVLGPIVFDDGGGSSAFVRSRQAEEAAARARSLSSEGQMNLRSSPWQDADGELSGSAAVASARRPAANAAGDGGSSRAVYHVPAPAASESLAVFEKPLLAALSGEDVGGVPSAEVSSLAMAFPFLLRPVCDHLAQDSSDPYMARASYYERLGRAARKYREGLSKDGLDVTQ